MPDAPAVPEGPPEGRSDPGGGSGLGKRIGPLPLGLWILVGGGVLAGVWWFRSHQSASSGTSTDPNASLQNGGAPDITTLQGLAQAMRDLAAKLGADAISPAPPAPSSQRAGVPGSLGSLNDADILNIFSTSNTSDFLRQYGQDGYNYAEGLYQGKIGVSNPTTKVSQVLQDIVGTTHTNGGYDTQAVASSGLPDTSITSRVSSLVTSGPSSIIKKVVSVPHSQPSTSLGGFVQRVAAVITGGAAGNFNPQTSVVAPPISFSSNPFDVSQRRSEREAG